MEEFIPKEKKKKQEKVTAMELTEKDRSQMPDPEFKTIIRILEKSMKGPGSPLLQR